MVEGSHLESVSKTMVGTLEEETGVPLPSIPDGLIFILSKVGNLLLQVRRLGQGMVASEELVRQIGERGPVDHPSLLRRRFAAVLAPPPQPVAPLEPA
ncbi:unnamed protein product [Linum trigynum]|uniref:Uncharacterized protein n=1 Tax=Linum trigynum TaxID=586398 RepID=A0AAV2FSW2_9ROSI